MDPTEHAHIDAIKVPFENTNNGQYGPQICRHLDCDEKRRLFDLATAIHETGSDLESIIYNSTGGQEDGDGEVLDGELNVDWATELDTVSTACSPSRKAVDLFATASALIARSASEGPASIPWPARTFSTSWAAFNFTRQPDVGRISVDLLAEKYNLPDLRPALLDFISEHLQNPSVHHIGGRRRTQMNT